MVNEVVWEILCDELGVREHIKANSCDEMVGELVRRGFVRLLKDDVPYQDEPLVLEDSKGRIWEAMPAHFPSVRHLPIPLEPAMCNYVAAKSEAANG